MKAAVDVDPSSLRGLQQLQRQLGDRFVAGLVVHCGDRVRPAGDRMWTVPVNALWEH